MFKTWLCVVCGLIYDEALGWPDDGIPAGTRGEDGKYPADSVFGRVEARLEAFDAARRRT